MLELTDKKESLDTFRKESPILPPFISTILSDTYLPLTETVKSHSTHKEEIRNKK